MTYVCAAANRTGPPPLAGYPRPPQPPHTSYIAVPIERANFLGFSNERGTIRGMDISVQHYGPDPNKPPNHALPGGRPDDLPIASAVYDASIRYGRDSQAVTEALYEAVKSLEAELRGRS